MGNDPFDVRDVGFQHKIAVIGPVSIGDKLGQRALIEALIGESDRECLERTVEFLCCERADQS